jgi:hypothetical protein
MSYDNKFILNETIKFFSPQPKSKQRPVKSRKSQIIKAGA